MTLFTAVQVGELEGLVINQDQDRFPRSEEGIESVLRGRGLGHGLYSDCDLVVCRPDIAYLLRGD